MNPKNLIGINSKVSNISESIFPYWWAFQSENSVATQDLGKKMVVFFGNDMATFTKMGTDADLYIKRCNRCLDYIRREFPDYKLFYKPHPADKDERASLDLKNFNVLEGDTNAEMFLFQNRRDIQAVFSVGSAAAYSAYAMGISAHVFYKCFNDIYDAEIMRPLDEFYFDMPKSFFVLDFDGRIIDNGRLLKKDERLELFFREALNKHKSKIWLVAFTIEHVVTFLALTRLVRSIEPARKIGLIVSRHRYWDALHISQFSKYFDEVIMWPRINYSLRPVKLWQALKVARQIKKFNISKDDILISISQNSFVENCINSYHNKNLRIGLIPDKDFNLFYNSQNSVYIHNDNFRFSKASGFFNKIFEPLLGLQKSVFMFYGRGKGSFITRYQKPLNEVFDKLIILKPSA